MSFLDPGNFAQKCAFANRALHANRILMFFSYKFLLRQRDVATTFAFRESCCRNGKGVFYLEQYSEGFQLYNLAVHITAEILAQLKGQGPSTKNKMPGSLLHSARFNDFLPLST